MTPADPGKRGGSGGDAPGATPAASRVGAGLAAVLLAALLLGALAGTSGATVPGGTFNTSNDTAAPEVGNLSKVGYTEVELTITDDTDVDESTIDGADVFVSDGTIANVTAAESGSNATVTITLESRLDTDRLGVAVADSATIADAAGNQLNASGDVWRYVEGMDGVAPSVTLYEVGNGSGDRIEVRIRTTEDLAETSVRLYGPAQGWLTLANFSKPSGISEYVASVDPPASGVYRVTVVNVTDANGNTQDTSRWERVSVDVVPPTAVAGIDVAASDGRTIVFDANRSSDDVGIRNLTWDFGDGTNASAWQPTHTFERGNYTVTLRVTDAVGHVGTDELVLNLTDANASAALVGDAGDAARISAGGSGSAMVSIPQARAGDPVEIARQSGAPLAATDAVSLDGLTVTLATNDTVSLGLEATDPVAVGDVADAGAGRPLGGLTVVHDVPDSAVDAVRFRFGVDAGRLADRGVDPAEVRLYRYAGGSWTELPTEHLEESDGRHRFRATSPGLSRFAVAPAPTAASEETTRTATPTPTSDLRVRDATLNRTTVPLGGAVRVNATVRNDGGAESAFTAGLSVDGEAARTRTVSVPSGAERTVSFVYRPASNGTVAIAVNGSAAGTLQVGPDAGGSPLGFVPFGLLHGLLTYLGGLAAAGFLLLKAAALYLGY